MAFFLLRPRLVLAAMVFSIPFAASGACGSRTACFQYTQAEYNLHNSCPAPADALAGFTSPSCPGSIVSVDSPGTFDGQICCYSVTYGGIDQSCANNGMGGAGAGPGSGTGTIFPGTTGSGTTTCASSCFMLLEGIPPLCAPPSALQAFTDLQTCAGCFGIVEDGGGCVGICPSFCASGPLEAECGSCLQESCLSAWIACQNN